MQASFRRILRSSRSRFKAFSNTVIQNVSTGHVEHASVRAARPDDYKAVLAIVPDLFGGADYLPNTYSSYFSDPKAHPYVGVVDGKVATFSNYYVMDNGETAVSTGGRTIAKYQGTGLNSKVTRASMVLAISRHPKLNTEARVVVDDEFYDMYRKPDPSNFQIIAEEYFLQYLTTKSKILTLLQFLENTPSLTEVNNTILMEKQKAETTLPTQLLNSDLLPQTSIITPVSYHPLHVYKENLEMICRTTDVVATMEGDTCAGVSFSLCSLFQRGPSVTTFYHVKTLKDMFCHLKLQLQQHKQQFTSDGNAILELSFPLGLSLESVKETLFPFLGKNDIYDSTPRETIMVLERPLKHIDSKL